MSVQEREFMKPEHEKMVVEAVVMITGQHRGSYILRDYDPEYAAQIQIPNAGIYTIYFESREVSGMFHTTKKF